VPHSIGILTNYDHLERSSRRRPIREPEPDDHPGTPKPDEPEPNSNTMLFCVSHPMTCEHEADLIERYAANLHGVLSCFDRILITGHAARACYAAGMTSF